MLIKTTKFEVFDKFLEILKQKNIEYQVIGNVKDFNTYEFNDTEKKQTKYTYVLLSSMFTVFFSASVKKTEKNTIPQIEYIPFNKIDILEREINKTKLKTGIIEVE
jgi:hypothetical protein